MLDSFDLDSCVSISIECIQAYILHICLSNPLKESYLGTEKKHTFSYFWQPTPKQKRCQLDLDFLEDYTCIIVRESVFLH